MLAISVYYPAAGYLPQRPSPLSPRSANAGSRIFPPCTMSQSSDAKRSTSAFKRPYKANPVLQSADKGREKRRDQFLRKVERAGDEKRWENRGDQIMRMDYNARRKRWEAEQARRAPRIEDEMEETEYDLPSSSSQPDAYTLSQPAHAVFVSSQQNDAEVDAIVQQEDEELNALLALMEEEERQAASSPSHFGSDDEDYDCLFMQVITEQSSQQERNPHQKQQRHTDDSMDTSNG